MYIDFFCGLFMQHHLADRRNHTPFCRGFQVRGPGRLETSNEDKNGNVDAGVENHLNMVRSIDDIDFGTRPGQQ